MNVIRSIEHARKTHLDWARYQEMRYRVGLEPTPDVGGATGHRKWVRIYDEVLRRLREWEEKIHGNQKSERRIQSDFSEDWETTIQEAVD